MSRIFLHGWGAVSPAGWGTAALVEAVTRGEPLADQPLTCPGRLEPLRARKVPAPAARPAFLGHPRLRRSSPISHFAVGAAIEALGSDHARMASGQLRLGIIFCAFAGCVGYSRRFYEEVLRDPATASPLIFPETVLNAPASHLAACFGTAAVNYTLVGDEGEFLKGLALAAEWLLAGQVDGCLVVGAEEADWLSAGALELFEPGSLPAEGAGAIYLRREPSAIELTAVTAPELFFNAAARATAHQRTRDQWQGLASSDPLLVANGAGLPALPALPAPVVTEAVLGQGLAAAGAWQGVFAAASLAQSDRSCAVVETSGSNEQVVAAVLRRA